MKQIYIVTITLFFSLASYANDFNSIIQEFGSASLPNKADLVGAFTMICQGSSDLRESSFENPRGMILAGKMNNSVGAIQAWLAEIYTVRYADGSRSEILNEDRKDLDYYLNLTKAPDEIWNFAWIPNSEVRDNSFVLGKTRSISKDFQEMWIETMVRKSGKTLVTISVSTGTGKILFACKQFRRLN